MGCCGGEDANSKFPTGGFERKRSCTDVLWVVAFGAFLFFWLGLASIAFNNGDPSKMLYAADSFGNLCGKDPGFENKPYVLYYDMLECFSGGPTQMLLNGGRCPSHQQCVAKCATEFWNYELHALKEILVYDRLRIGSLNTTLSNPEEFWNKFYCKPQAEPTLEAIKLGKTTGAAVLKSFDELMEWGECSGIQLSSKPIANRCFPGSQEDETTCEEAKTRIADHDPGLIWHGRDASLTKLSAEDRQKKAETDVVLKQKNAAAAACSMNGTDIEQPYGMREILADLSMTWKLVVIMLSIAIIVSLFWLVFLRYCGAVVVWTFVVAVNAGIAGGAIYGYFKWQELLLKCNEIKMQRACRGLVDAAGLMTAKYVNLCEDKPEDKCCPGNTDLCYKTIFSILDNHNLWFWVMIVCSIIFVLIFLLTLFMIKRIRMATTILGEATQAVGAIPSTILFPLWSAILYCAVIFWYLSVATYTATAATAVYRVVERDPVTSQWSFMTDKLPECNITLWNDRAHPEIQNPDKSCVLDDFYDNYGWTNSTIIVQLYHMFGFYWTLNIAAGMCQMTLAGAFALWYFAPKNNSGQKDLEKSPLLKSSKNVIWHFGTIACGAFIIALVQTLREILKYIDKKTKRYQNNIFIKIVFKTCQCCLWCMEKCLKFITKNAYIVTAIYGYNFCRACCKSMKLIICNAGRMAAVSLVSNFLLFLGKLMISGGLATLGWFMFHDPHHPQLGEIFQYLVPEHKAVKSTDIVIVVIFVGSYLIANAFFKVYHMAISTIFISVLEDLDHNDGSAAKPYKMSKSLMKAFCRTNKTKSC